MKAIEKYNFLVNSLCENLNKEIIETFVAEKIHWTFIGENKNPFTKVLVAFFDEEDSFYSLIEMPSLYQLYNDKNFALRAIHNCYQSLLNALCTWNGNNIQWDNWSWKLAFDLCESNTLNEKTLTDDEISYDVTFSPMTNINVDESEIKGLTDEEFNDLVIQKAIDKIVANPRDYINFDNFVCLKQYKEGE